MGELESPLKELKAEQDHYERIKMQLKELSQKIEILNRETKIQKRYIDAKNSLNTIVDRTDDDMVKNSLITAMRSRVVADWHLFDHPTRAHLNRYIDLLKAYPGIESECEEKVSELTRLRTECEEKKSAAEDLHNRIISQCQCMRQIIEELPDKADSVGEKRFKIAFSFPGEYRETVHKIVMGVADKYTKKRILYDKFLSGELARPNLDIYLQNLYKNESELIVVFLCADYNSKKWCGIEWRAIRDLLNSREADDRILFVKCGDGEVDGVFGTIDGYIDSTQVCTDEIIADIVSRYDFITHSRRNTNHTDD
ncbi:MAG: hypothetical protein NC489_42345, partial [Ruminococcus flavefaciens]|nr:hypothetical protein [Ruminococcus flavefaciens]